MFLNLNCRLAELGGRGAGGLEWGESSLEPVSRLLLWPPFPGAAHTVTMVKPVGRLFHLLGNE